MGVPGDKSGGIPPDKGILTPRQYTACLVAACGFLALLFLVKMPTQFVSGDAPDEVNWALDADSEIRSSHLLTTPFNRCILTLSGAKSWADKPFLVMQVVSIAIGLGCMVLLYRTIVLWDVARGWALFFTMVFGLSSGMREHTMFAETGIHPQFFTVLGLYFLAQYLRGEVNRRVYLVLLLASFSMSVLFALNMVLLIPGVIAALLWDQRRRRDISVPRILVTAAAVFVSLLVVPFLVGAFLHGVRSVPEFFRWMLVHPEAERLTHMRRSWGAVRLLRPVAGLIRVFWYIGAGLKVVKITLRGDSFQAVGLRPYLSLAFGLSVLFSVGVLTVKGTAARRKDPLTLCFWIGLALLYGFNAYWTGSDTQFWLPGLPMILLLTAAGATAWFEVQRRRPVVLVLLGPIAVTLALAVQSGTELPSLVCPSGGPAVARARRFAGHLAAGDVVFVPGRGWSRYLPSMRSDVNIVSLPYDRSLGKGEACVANVTALVRQALVSGHRVCFDGLVGPKHPDHYGMWQMFQSGTGVSREQLRVCLEERYALNPVADSSFGGMHLVRRRVSGQEER